MSERSPRTDLRVLRWPELSDEFGWWFSGIVDGEGCFYIGPQGCQFIISLRADDAPVLKHIQENLGVGRITVTNATLDERRPNQQSRFEVSRKHHCAYIASVFDQYPLRSKKARDLAIWREAVTVHCAGANPSELLPYKSALAIVRRYDEDGLEQIASVQPVGVQESLLNGDAW